MLLTISLPLRERSNAPLMACFYNYIFSYLIIIMLLSPYRRDARFCVSTVGINNKSQSLYPVGVICHETCPVTFFVILMRFLFS